MDPIPIAPDMVVKVANINDLWFLIQERGEMFKKYAEDSFEHGDLCFIVEHEGKAVSCLWGRPRDIYLSWVEYTIHFDEDTIGAADGYTHPDYRGKGLYTVLFSSLIEYVHNHPTYEKVYGFIEPKNTLSMEVHKKMGFKKIISKIKFVRICGIKKHYVENG